jgi:hypothetical protein
MAQVTVEVAAVAAALERAMAAMGAMQATVRGV